MIGEGDGNQTRLQGGLRARPGLEHEPPVVLAVAECPQLDFLGGKARMADVGPGRKDTGKWRPGRWAQPCFPPKLAAGRTGSNQQSARSRSPAGLPPRTSTRRRPRAGASSAAGTATTASGRIPRRPAPSARRQTALRPATCSGPGRCATASVRRRSLRRPSTGGPRSEPSQGGERPRRRPARAPQPAMRRAHLRGLPSVPRRGSWPMVSAR